MLKTKCFRDAMASMNPRDVEAIEQGVQERVKAGAASVATVRVAELGAVQDVLAEIARERAEVLRLVSEQHPGVKAAPAGQTAQATHAWVVPTYTEYLRRRGETEQAAPAAQPVAEPAVSSREGQMRLANRGSRIASLKMMNDQLRRVAPDEAWADSNIESAADPDALQDQISEALVRAQRGPEAANPLRAELEAMSGAELRAVMERMNLAGARMTQDERIAALLAEDPAEVRAAVEAEAPAAQPQAEAEAEGEFEPEEAETAQPAPSSATTDAQQAAPSEAEAVGEFEPDAASLPELIQAYKSAKEVERALADAKNVNLSELARAVDATRDARAPLVAKLAEQPALSAMNGSGLRRIVAGSAQKQGQWQLTRFDQNGEPWGDSQYTSQEAAIDDFLREVDIDTLEVAEAPAAQPEVDAAPAVQPEAEAEAEVGGPAPMPAVAGIPREVAQNAHRGTSFVPEERAGQEQRSFMAALEDAWNRAARIAGTDEKAVERIREVFTDVAQGYRERYMRTLEARGRVMSSMIAGPARFPVERNRKRMETERRRSEEAEQYLARGVKRLIRAARGPIDNSPESELESIRLRLAEREETQETMKAANAALRKDDDAALEDLGFTAEQIAELKKGDFAGRKGFPDYRLTNNNAEIRRLRSRLEEAEARLAAAQAGPTETERAGVRIVEDAQDDRLRLIFDGKPSDEVREDLKANGFKWSPKNGAWQRALTDNARYAAKRVLDKHFPADDAGNVAMFRRAEQKSREAAARIERNGGVTSPDDLRDLMGAPGYGLRAESAIAGDVDASAALSAELREAFPAGDWKAPRLGGRGIVTIQSDWLAGLGAKQTESLNRLSEILGRYGAPAIVRGPSTVDADALRGAGFVRYRGMQEMGARSNVAGAPAIVGIAWIKEGGGISQVTPLYRRGPQAEAKLTDVQQAVDTITASWANPPDVRVVWDLQDPEVDEDVRAEDARQRRNGATGTPKAFFFRGKVYIVASVAGSDFDVARSLFHESLGHAGLRAAFGDQLKPVLSLLAKTNRAAVEAKAKEYGMDMADEAQKLRAAEEVLAELAETRPTSTWVQRAIAAIRTWLRDNLPGIFGDMTMSDAEIIRNFIVPARDAIVRGKEAQGRNARPMFMRDGEDTGPFYSALTQAVQRADMKAAGAQGWKMFLKGQIAKGAIKQDEVTWSGVEEWIDMQPGKVSREAVADYLRENGVRVTETQSPPGESIGTQDFRRWQLPGGTRYREVLLTLPDVDRVTANKNPERIAELEAKGRTGGLSLDEADELRELRGQQPMTAARQEYRSSHWYQPNILAHIRLNDRTDAEGKRVLFVEELQSDYAQDARRKGLSTDMIPQSREWFDADTLDTLPTEAEAQAKRTELMPFLERNREPGMETRLVVKRDGDLWSVIEQSRSATDTAPNRGGVPPAPFIDKTDKWVALALKRVIKMAVDEGYDRVAFVTGAQSAERYDLSRHIDRIHYEKSEDGKYELIAYKAGSRDDSTGSEALHEDEIDLARIEALVGKEIAQKIADEVGESIGGPYRDWRELKGVDLKVGGEGMVAFYDKIVPAALKDVLKKVGGGQVGVVQIGGGLDVEGVTRRAFDGAPFEALTPEAQQWVRDKAAEQGTTAGTTQPGFTITPAMREKASSGLPLFRRGGAEAGKVAAQDLINAKGGIFDFNRLGETKQDRVRTVIDGAREFWLGALTRDQIADVYGDEITPVRDYDNLTRLMENERQKRAQDADKLYTEWSKLDEETNDKLGRIMLDATVYQVHPDEETAAGDAKARIIHARIKREFKALPQEARDIYGKVKAFHQQTLADLQAAVEARIDRQVENGQAKAAALTNVRKMFDQYLEGGPYFPLSRFGDYLVIGKRESDGEKVVAAYETAGEQQAAARALEKDGFTVKTKTAKAYSRQMDGAAGKFIGDVMQAVEKLDMVEATVNGSRSDLKNQLLDDLNQMFIRALPDLSYRKHFLHRKNTPGFSADVMRGFASSAFHSASHIARLNHGDQMTFALSDAYQAIENAPEGDFNKHVQVLNELAKRHDASLNPNTHPLAAALNQIGFVMYLGLSPAAGLVNLLQTPMVTLPHLGARYGFTKASASLGRATKDIMAAPMNRQSGWDATASDKLTAAEKAAMRELQDEGIIDLTQAHDLAAASGLDTGNVARSKAAFAMARAMKIVGWTFHVPEVMNRQATALSAYRLEMQKSGDVEKAKDAAREAIKRTHFDYSSSNRARYMQGNLARVVMQFKAYAQNMTYLLGRAAQQALQGETPEVRSIARRQLVATLGATWAMAGTLGLPALGAVMGAISSMVNALDDDDEPWDWKVEFRNLMADTFGKEVGEVIAHGIPRAIMPWDISGRVGMGELWWRSNDREGQNPREAFASDIATNILGPTGGTVLGWYTAADHMARGNYAKATEAIVPKFIRDPLKAYREATDGVTTYTGEPMMETTAAEEIGRLLGFAPASVSEMYSGMGAVMNAKTAIAEKRQTLLARVVKARLDRDSEAESEARDEIREFNRRNPQQAITPDGIRRSLRNRLRNRDRREAGVLLPESQEYLRDRGRFAVTE